MSALRQAALQAFEALQLWAYQEQRDAARAALHAAIAEHDRLAGIEAIEKDAGIHVSQQAEPEQEPVAWMYPHQLQEVKECGRGGIGVRAYSGPSSPNLVPVYTAPTPRKPLADEALHQVIRAGNYDSMEQFARAIERAHGIGSDA